MRRTRWMQWIAAAVVVFGLALSAASQVIINEVAWGGTAASASDEWIELMNTSDQAVDLTGWTVRIAERVVHLGEVADATLEVRRSVIEAGGYLLLERTDDTTISDIAADVIYTGGLSNGGEDLLLVDANGVTVDEILAAEAGWPAGTGGDDEVYPYTTMERFDPPYQNADWAQNAPMAARNGTDAEGEPIYGTPRSENSTVVFVSSAPRVEILSPSPDVVEGTLIVLWAAVDPDGDDTALIISIYATSSDSGEVLPIAENVANTGSFAWDTADVEDGVYAVEIWAQDANGFAVFDVLDSVDVRND